MLSEQEKSFLQKRRKLNRAWTPIGILMILFLVGMYVYFFFRVPLMVNPYFVGDLLKQNNLAYDTMRVLAITSPCFATFVFAVVLIMIIYTWSAVCLEKKYMKIIDKIMPDEENLLRSLAEKEIKEDEKKEIPTEDDKEQACSDSMKTVEN